MTEDVRRNVTFEPLRTSKKEKLDQLLLVIVGNPMRNALFIQHNATNDPGSIAKIGMGLHVHRSDEQPSLPSLDDFDALILGGGPQAAYTDLGFPSRRAELRLLDEALNRGFPILGVCLGSQLLALAAGGTVARRPAPETGWLPVTLTDEGVEDPFFAGCPKQFIPKHWHFDGYTLPPGAVRLAESQDCDQQAYRLGTVFYGVQFHFESNEARARLQAQRPQPADGIERPSLRRQLEGAKALLPVALRMLKNFEAIVEEHYAGSSPATLGDAEPLSA